MDGSKDDKEAKKQWRKVLGMFATSRNLNSEGSSTGFVKARAF